MIKTLDQRRRTVRHVDIPDWAVRHMRLVVTVMAVFSFVAGYCAAKM